MGPMTSFRDELRDVAHGLRWGRRPLTPAPRTSDAPPKQWSFPTDWARTERPASTRATRSSTMA